MAPTPSDQDPISKDILLVQGRDTSPPNITSNPLIPGT